MSSVKRWTGINWAETVAYRRSGSIWNVATNVNVRRSGAWAPPPPPPPVPQPTITSIVPNPGPAGPVTINGTNFTNPAVVNFAGAGATSVVVVSPIKITCNAPVHADGAVSVTVTTNGGTSSAFTFTYQGVPPPTNPVPTGVPGTWTLSFQDEFSGTSIDRSKWNDVWFADGATSPTGGQTIRANVSVGGGVCTMKLLSSTSGSLISTNPNGGATVGYQFTTGVAETRLFMPGDGSHVYNWGGFWTSGQNWPTTGENDVAENLSGSTTVNYHSAGPNSANQGAVPGYWGGAFHVYTIHRKPTSTDVYYDGVLRKSYATDEIAPHYIIINNGSGGNFPFYGTPGADFQVDYVRAWT